MTHQKWCIVQPKIEDYLDWFWFYGLSKKGPKIEHDKFYDVGYITNAMFELGFYSERKNTKQLSDVVVDNPDAPIVDEMDLTEIQRLIEYME